MNTAEALRALRDCVAYGLRDQAVGWRLVTLATAAFPPDERIRHLSATVADLLVAIELESILGGPKAQYQRQLSSLLDWVEKYEPSMKEGANR